MADIAQGTVLAWNGTTIPKVTDFSGPGLSHATIDVSDLSQTAMEFIAAGIYDAGELTLSLNFEPDEAVHAALATDLQAGTERVFSITFADGGSTDYTSNAFCTSFEPSGSVADKLSTAVTIKFTGHMTL